MKRVKNKRRLEVLFAVLFSFLISTYCFSDSDQHPDYFDEWLETLRKGNAKERIFALILTPSFLDCCQYKKNPQVFDLILNALQDKNPSIREAAAACLAERVDRYSMKCCEQIKIVQFLIKTLGDRNARVRQEAVKALAFFKDERAVDGLIKSLDDKDPWVRLNAVFALGELKALKAVDPLLNLLEDDSDWRNKFVQQECVKAIRKIGSPTAIGLGGGVIRITPETRHRDGRIITPGTSRRETPGPPTKIGGFDDETTAKVISVLIRKSDDPYLRALIIGAFAQFKAVEAREILLKAKEDPDEKIRKLALEALLQISAIQAREDLRIRPEPSKRYSEDMLDMLKKSMKDPSAQIRANAVAALGKSGDEGVVDLLIEALRDSDRTVRRNAIEGLGQFRDEKILDSMLSFFGKGELYLDDTEQLASKTFMSIAEKTTREWVFVHRRDGIRYVSKDTFDIPREAKISRRMVHPIAAGKLIEIIGRSDEKGKLPALDLLSRFEDRRIEGVLLKLLNDPSPQLRGRAISLLPYFFDNSVVPQLIMASKDKDGGVRVAAVRALGEFDDKRGLEPLIERLDDGNPEVRAAALHSLKGYENSKLSDRVIRLLSDDSVSVRRSAVSNIRERKDRRAVGALIDALNDNDFLVPAWSADALGAIGDKSALHPLTRAMKGEFNKNRMYGGDIDLRKNAIKSLGLIGEREAVPALLSMLEERELRTGAITALGSLKDPRAVPPLIKCLSDEDQNVRRLAATALREIGDPTGLEAVKDIPEVKPPPRVGSATPIRPKDVKPPPPSSVPKEPSPGSGYSRIMFPKHEKIEEKKPPSKEEKPTTIPTPPATAVVSKYEPEPRPSVDIKPLLPKLKANDSKIRREAADSLGDAGNQEATDHLIPLLKDRDEYVRQAAARALGKLKDKKTVEPLIAGLNDPEVNVRAFSIWALGEIQDPRAIEPLCSSLLDKEQKIRDHSFEAIRKFREPASRKIMVNTLIKGAKINSSASGTLWKLISLEGREVILRAMEDPQGDQAKTLRNYIDLMEANIQNVSDIGTKALVDYPDRGMVISELSNYISTQTGTPTPSISLLGRLKDRRALPFLLDALNKRKDSYYRLTVINAMDELGDKEAVEPLLQILVDDKESPGPRMAAARALGKFGDARAVEPLLQILRDERANKDIKRDATSVLGTFRDKRAVEPLINILKSTNEDIWLRVAAASSLGNIGDQRAIDPLQDALKDPSDYIRNAAQTALQKIKTN